MLIKIISELIEDENSREEIENLAKQYTLELLEVAHISTRYGIRDFDLEEAEKVLSALKMILNGIQKAH
jgi:hypothetical protein